MSPKQLVALVLTVIVLVIGISVLSACANRNDNQNWQVVQKLDGTTYIRDDAGIYFHFFAKKWTYPRFMEFRYNDDSYEGDREKESIRVTFNDGGTAQVSTYVRVQTPIAAEDRLKFHQQFAGTTDNIKAAVKAHLTNCLKTTGPLMSASEHQSARKAEFSQIVENQLVRGLFEMRKVEKELKDRFDEKGKPVTVYATEFVLDEQGKIIIAQESPLTTDYKMHVTQFSATGTEYDPETLQQFAAKKQSYLAAEKSKAQREEMVQDRLRIQEEGLRDKAEAEAIANVEKAKAVIAAEQKAEVALQTKIEAETKAEQMLSVAEIEKQEALTIANKELEVATIEAQAAEQTKLAMIAEAEGKQKAIELSGEITNLEQALIKAEVLKAEVIAKAIGELSVPQVMFIGGSGAGEAAGQDAIMTNLINLKLLEGTNLLDTANAKVGSVNAKRLAK